MLRSLVKTGSIMTGMAAGILLLQCAAGIDMRQTLKALLLSPDDVHLHETVRSLRREIRQLKKLLEETRTYASSLERELQSRLVGATMTHQFINALTRPANGEQWWWGGDESGLGTRCMTVIESRRILWPRAYRDVFLLMAGACIYYTAHTCFAYTWRRAYTEARVSSGMPLSRLINENTQRIDEIDVSSAHVYYYYFFHRQRVRSEARNDGGDGGCCICLETLPVSSLRALVPCGHRCVCSRHAAQLLGQPCPLCRENVEKIIAVFD